MKVVCESRSRVARREASGKKCARRRRSIELESYTDFFHFDFRVICSWLMVFRAKILVQMRTLCLTQTNTHTHTYLASPLLTLAERVR